MPERRFIPENKAQQRKFGPPNIRPRPNPGGNLKSPPRLQPRPGTNDNTNKLQGIRDELRRRQGTQKRDIGDHRQAAMRRLQAMKSGQQKRAQLRYRVGKSLPEQKR